MELTDDEKFKFSNHLSQFTDLFDRANLNPFKGYGFKLAEISFGHGNYNIANNSDIFYFDFPYPNIAKGKIIDAVNNSQRGILPGGSSLNKDTYKNLDIELAMAFASRADDIKSKDGYVFYKFIPNEIQTPDIVEIKTNISPTIIDETRLKNYFFLIYHCSELSINYKTENIFNRAPKLLKDVRHKDKYKYLLYFNYRDHENDNNQAITAAFLGDNDYLFTDIESKPETVKTIYSVLFPLLVNMFNNPVLTYFQKENAIANDKIERIRNSNAANHILKTYLNTKVEPKVNYILNKYGTGDNQIEALANNVRKLQSTSELLNLLDKINNTKNENTSEIKGLLIDTGFYSEKADSNLDIISFVKSIFNDNWNFDKNNIQINLIIENLNGLDYSFLAYEGLTISKDFLELFLLTILENVADHALKENGQKNIYIEFDLDKKTLSVKNKTELLREADYNRPLTGNFRTINKLLEKLKVGKLEASQEANSNIFLTKLIDLNHGK